MSYYRDELQSPGLSDFVFVLIILFGAFATLCVGGAYLIHFLR